MTMYALKNSAGTALRYQDFTEIPPTLAQEKGLTWVQENQPAPPPESPEQAAARLGRAVDSHIDAGARAAGYDNIANACGYAAAPNPFQAESQSFVTWRGNVWGKCFEVMAEVQAGARAIPTEAELIALLPVRSA